jgi:Regulator of chromosome condensation (RCC1) repeat
MVVAMLGSGAARADVPVNDIQRLAVSDSHGCAVTRGGALRCYGNNGQGQLGTGAAGSYRKLAEQVIASGVTAVAVGHQHTCAIVGGALYCWGDNSVGQIGNGKEGGIVAKPAPIIDGGVTAVSAGGDNTCAVVRGALKCWGRNAAGEGIRGSMNQYVASPAQVIAEGVTAVATGGQHTCAVVNGELKCWGFMVDPDGPGFRTLLEPTTFIAKGVTAVAAAIHTCAVASGALLCWGRNFNGQVGVSGGYSVAPHAPTQVIAGGVTDVVADSHNSCAIVQSALYCWGSNQFSQLGSPPSLNVNEPRRLIPQGVSAVGVGMRQVCAVVDGTLQCTNRAFDEDEASQQDWTAFGDRNTPFGIPEPELPRLARYGLWRGTIGKQEVIVLLEPKGCGPGYYYLKHLWGISLVEKDKRGQIWKEGRDGSATWTFESASERTLNGQWTGDGAGSVPIRLERVRASKAEKNACGSLANAYNEARVAAQKPVLEDAEFDGHRYRSVAVLAGAINGVEIPGDRNRVPRLGRMMRDWLHGNIGEYYECQTDPTPHRNAKNPVPDFSKEMTPVFWNERLLVLRETYSSYCGGAHPSGGIGSYVVWDSTEDKPLEPWGWIRGSKGKYGSYVAPAELNALIHSIYVKGRDDECAEVIRSTEYYLVYPGKAGMVFSPSLPHVVRACADDIEVPYAKLRPHLTPKGTAIMKSLQLLESPPRRATTEAR